MILFYFFSLYVSIVTCNATCACTLVPYHILQTTDWFSGGGTV